MYIEAYRDRQQGAFFFLVYRGIQQDVSSRTCADADRERGAWYVFTDRQQGVYLFFCI